MHIILIIICLLCVVSPTQAQNSTSNLPDYKLGILSSYALSDDAISNFINPAGLGVRDRATLFLSSSTADTMLHTNIGVQLGALGFGFQRFEQDKRRNIPYFRANKFTLSCGFELGDDSGLSKIGKSTYISERTYLGFAWNKYKSSDDELDNLSTWDIGLLYRTTNYISIGGVIKNLNEPTLYGDKVERNYGVGMAIRPFTNRVHLYIDGSMNESQSFKNAIYDDRNYHYGITTEIIDGVILSGDIDGNKNYSLQAGVNLTKGGFGISSIFNNNNKNTDNFVYAHTSSDQLRTSFVKKNKIAVIELSGEITDERKGFSLFGGSSSTLIYILNDIKKAKKDKEVAGILLKINNPILGFATAEEIKNALADFKTSGKKIVSFFEDGGMMTLYLSSESDKIIMPESGYVNFTGLRSEVMLMKGLLKKLGIEMEVAKDGKYKSAPEAFISDSLSAPAKEQLNDMLDDIYEQLVEAIGKNRGWSVEKTKEIIDSFVFTAKKAKEVGLIDEFGYYDDALLIAGKLTGKYEKAKEGDSIKKVDISKKTYRDYSWLEKPKIAVIYASGTIVSGESSTDIITGRKVMGSETIAEAIKQARKDKSIRAIVLRVDSPGGSGLASDIIWQEVKKTREDKKNKKPIIVSMGDVAASGGYYISCSADKIFADKGTITGSIGAFSVKPNMSGTFDKLGLKYEIFKRGKYADFFTTTRGFTDEEKELFRKINREGYEEFIGKVAEGRKMSVSQVDSLGQGHVYTGKRALGIKLVDEIGGIREAVDYAKKMANIKGEADIVFYPKREYGLYGAIDGWALTIGKKSDSRIVNWEEIFSKDKVWYIMPWWGEDF